MRLGFVQGVPGSGSGGGFGGGPAGGIDAAFAALAAALGGQGLRVAGAVQRTERTPEGRLAGMELELLPDGPAVDIARKLGAGSAGCRLDPGALEQATEEIARRVKAGADLLIVPRFGEREAEGGGFRAAIAAALERDVPVLVGLAPSWRAAFEAFAEGLAEPVPADPAALRAWALGARGAA